MIEFKIKAHAEANYQRDIFNSPHFDEYVFRRACFNMKLKVGVTTAARRD